MVKKQTRKVIIKNGKGYKSLCTYKNGKKCHNKKKHLSKLEIQMIKMGKFIPNLFSDIKSQKLVKITIKFKIIYFVLNDLTHK